MAISYHLKIEGVEGEASQKGHEKEIALTSYSIGCHNPTSVHAVGGLTSGKVEWGELTVGTTVDKSTTKVIMACCKGSHFDKGVLTCDKSTASGSPETYLTFTFTTLHVSSYQTGGSHGDDHGSASISFAFGEVKVEYKFQDKTGKLTTAGTIDHSLITGVTA